jgi:hypothetical protein
LSSRTRSGNRPAILNGKLDFILLLFAC